MKKTFLTLMLLPLLAFAQKAEFIELGSKAPFMDQALRSTADDNISLSSQMSENGLLVMFTSNTCPFVVMWEDRYKLVEALCKENNIGMVYINSNYKKRDGADSYEKMQQHAARMEYSAPYLYDEKSKLANAFKAKTTPHVFLLNNNHEVVYMGAIDDSYRSIDKVKHFYASDAITQLSAGEKIKKPSTKPVGCSIKRYNP